ncbi:unnamed protein product [Tilletia controversa]|uniref:UBA domain-containing protein n=1 Tax=Tilletia controversa TaxID=13291 RepID=A0A8X7MWG0_9BASI|nr:hypothetical protein CF328_g2792 [Tilletia controversa]KAE8252566.1 hypothetical protein A4X06_0g2094 [Tilletia controversa]CAD6928081.1 unnamed protein product [Tilletia controversa]CAD6929844.1 unnamed protein product [Tilletia controversa]CAD6938810.1 unnamed protein product [Tilletia controversa]
MDDDRSKIQSIVDICGCNEGTALRLLQAASYDLNSAIDRFFTNGVTDLPEINSAGRGRNGGSSTSAAFPAPPAIKKYANGQPVHSADAVDVDGWIASQPSFQGGTLPFPLLAFENKTVKFDETSLGTGGGSGSGTSSSSPGIRPNAWASRLDHVGSQSSNDSELPLRMFARPEALHPQQQRKESSEVRVKRARPHTPGDQPDHPDGSSPTQSNAAKRSTSLRFSEQNSQEQQSQDHMQLDTPPPEPENDNSDMRYVPTGPDPADGWNADLPPFSTALVPCGPDNFGSGRRPPSPPPRREEGSGDINALQTQLSSKEDYDLERALQASLEDQGGNGGGGGGVGGGGGGIIEEDDPELAAAIQASMTDAGMVESWYSTGSGGFGSKSSAKAGQRDKGKVPDHLRGLRAKVIPKAPTALAAPFESLRLFPLILHAIYALPPIRRGFQTYEMDRLSSINDMSSFWTGVAAGKKSNAGGLGKWISNEEREKADIVQRLQVLFFFMDRTSRPYCMTGSVLETLPQSVMTLNSGMPDPADVAMYTVGSLFDAYRTAVRAVAGRHSDDQEGWIADKTRIFDSLVSYGMPAPPWPTDIKEGDVEGGGPSSTSTSEPTTTTTATTAAPAPATAPAPVMPTLQNNPLTIFNSTHLELRHTNIVNDMSAAVLTVLEDDAALVTEPGHTLCVAIKHELPKSDGGAAVVGSKDKGRGKEGAPINAVGGSGFRPWRIDKHFYADPFLWERRRGVPHGQAPGEADRMEELKRRREELTLRIQRRKWLSAPGGKDTLSLMKDSIVYLEGPGLQSGDTIRTQTNQEAAVKLRQMRDHLQNELGVLDEVIAAEEEKIAKGHAERIDNFRQAYEGKPEWQTVRYDLRAILMKSGDAAWAYVQHRGQWYRIQDGHIHPTDEATAIGDESGAMEPYGGVFFLAYVRSDAIPGLSVNEEYEERKRMGLVLEDEAETMGELMEHGVEGALVPPESFREAIDTDNEEHEAVLLSLASFSHVSEDFHRTSPSSSFPGTMDPAAMLAMINGGGGFRKDTTIDLSDLLKEEHDLRGGSGSPSSSVVVEIDFRDDP